MSTEISSASKDKGGENPLLSIVLCVRDCDSHDILDRVEFAGFYLASDDACQTVAEVVVVDSSRNRGSAMKIREIVESFGGVYVRDDQGSKKYGLARARNVGGNIARGRFLLFVDVDLIPPANFIDSVKNFIQSGRVGRAENFFSIVPVFYLREVEYPDCVAQIRKTPLTDWIYGDSARSVDSIQLVNSTLLLRKSFYQLLGGQHEGFRGWGMEDWHFLWKLMSFPQPIPGVSGSTAFHRNPPSQRNELNTWRDAAWFFGEEALRHGLALFHIPHQRRLSGWRTNSSENDNRFNALVSGQVVFENTESLKTGETFCVYSKDPVAANALLFPPDALLKAASIDDLKRLLLRRDSFPNAAGTPVIGGSNLDANFYEVFSRLMKNGVDFDFVYPSGVSRIVFYFSYRAGKIHSPRTASDPVWVDSTEIYDQEAAAVDAYRYRNTGWRRDKLLTLFVLTEEFGAPIDSTSSLGEVFGMPSTVFRSMVNALIPALSPDVAAMVYDSGTGDRPMEFAASGAHDVSDREIDVLIEASDVVIAQSPRFVLNAVALGKPVMTTGTLLADLLPEVPIARQLYDIHTFIEASRVSPKAATSLEIASVLSRASVLVVDQGEAPAVADLLRRNEEPRVLYEQVATPSYEARFNFTKMPGNPELQAWLYPHLDRSSASQLHQAVTSCQGIRDHKSSTHGRQHGGKGDLHTEVSSERETPDRGGVLHERFAASECERKSMYRRKQDKQFSRRMAKLKRDPHRYFADSKYPVLRMLRFVFIDKSLR